jgi:hypothetical protein
MKRLILALGVLALLAACASFWPKPPVISGVVTLEAQALPVSRTLAWDANAASDNVTHYVVRMNGTVIGSPTGTTQPVTFTTLGTHTLAVRAVNLWGESPDATLIVNVIAPVAPRNLRLQ